LYSILELGNLEFDDSLHRNDEAKPCTLTDKSKKSVKTLCAILTIKESDLEKMLLFEKKIILKEMSYSAYNKNKCITNANTLSKAIYNAIFEFILFKIQKSLKPDSKGHTHLRSLLSINILDIFGFENFATNSFEQLCINFTNEKLLKLYNQYVFEREMEILREDGLDDKIDAIKPPTN
jgi:myosin heavy subunit